MNRMREDRIAKAEQKKLDKIQEEEKKEEMKTQQEKDDAKDAKLKAGKRAEERMRN